MVRLRKNLASSLALTTMATLTAIATLTTGCSHHRPPVPSMDTCLTTGPQTPRDIDRKEGTNRSQFSFAPEPQAMNLCNIHFHDPAEHKAAAFSTPAASGAGFLCTDTAEPTTTELAMPAEDVCGGLKPGSTIEVHWVYTSCDVKPGKGLGACSSASCGNPNLRVETQVFLVVNDSSALNFADFEYRGNQVNGYHQPKSLPTGTGTPVSFLGSTTGPSFSDKVCSPLQVSWNVRPQCAKLDLKSLGAWCKDNVFGEDHAHGVRPLVEELRLLAPIR